MSTDHEVIIIGGGFAGSFAAALCAQSGLKTACLSQTRPYSDFFSGAFDFFDDPGASREDSLLGAGALKKILDDFPRSGRHHVYQDLLAAGLPRPLSALLNEASTSFFKTFGLHCRGNGVDYQRALTPSGIFKPTAYVLDGVGLPAQGNLTRETPLTIIEIEGLKDYPAPLLKHQLKAQGYVDVEITRIRLKSSRPEYLSSLDVAQGLDTSAEDLWRQLPRREGRTLVFPPVLGIKSSDAIQKTIREDLRVPFLEVLSLPPSVIGLRVREKLDAKLSEIVVRHPVHVVRVNETPEGVEVEAREGDTPRIFRCRRLILATGKKNLKRERGVWRHELLDLSLSDGQRFLDSQGPDQLLDAHESNPQPLFGVGLKVDRALRPFDARRKYRHVHACGHALAGFDFGVERCGFGVSVLSAYLVSQDLIHSK